MLQFLRDLSDPLFDLLALALTTFHGWGAPWWLSIVMLTVVVRTFLFPLTVRQVGSMRRTQELRPEIQELQRKYKNDPQKLKQELLKLYAERKVNPLGGFLPAFVQLPIFLVLYLTIKEFETLEGFRTGGLLWFQDLTVFDPFYILPVLYVATMMVSQEIAMRNTAPAQRRIMRLLPIVFGVVLARFPAGLLVYWVANNFVSIVQNLIVYRDVPKTKEDRTEAPATRPPGGQKPQASAAPPPRTEPGVNGDGRSRTKTKRKKKVKKR